MAGCDIYSKAKIKDDILHLVALKSFFKINLIQALLIFKLTVKVFPKTRAILYKFIHIQK